VDVTLFATLDSVTSALLDGVCPQGYAEDPGVDGRVWEAMHVAHALARSGEFDLVHNHLDWLPLAFADHCRAPLLTTVHGFSGAGILPAYARARSAYVSISDADRATGLDYVATVYHGVDLGGLPFNSEGGPGLVAFGRVHPDKGTHTAIEIARLAGRFLAPARRCCTRSPSMSRSAFRWSNRWRAARRWWRTGAGPCPKLSMRV
jgi:hypothetical protein